MRFREHIIIGLKIVLFSFYILPVFASTITIENIERARILFSQNDIPLSENIKIVRLKVMDKKGNIVVNCEQYYQGLPILTGSVSYFFDNMGLAKRSFSNSNEYYLTGEIFSPVGVSVDIIPRVSEQEAHTIFYDYFKTKSINIVLGIFNINRGVGGVRPIYQLVWSLEENRNEMIINAIDGKIISSFDGIFY